MTQAALGQQLLMSSAPPPQNSVKTRKDVIALFEEIRTFCKVPVQFKLADLHEKDRLIEDDNVEKNPPPLTTKITAVYDRVSTATASKPARSWLSPLKGPPQRQQHHQQGKSFASLMFNLPSFKPTAINLPRGIKPMQVRKVVVAKKDKTSAKRNTLVTITKAPSLPRTQKLPPCDSIFARMNSCKAHMESMEAKRKALLEAESQAKKRAPITRTRRRQNLRPPPKSDNALLLSLVENLPLLLETPPPSCKTFESSTSLDSGVGDDAFSPCSSNADISTVDECLPMVIDNPPPMVDQQQVDNFGDDLLDFDNLVFDEEEVEQQLQLFGSKDQEDFDVWLNNLNL